MASSSTDLAVSELGRLVGEIIEAIDKAKATTTHTNAARKALDKIDAAYSELTARANDACAKLTNRLAGSDGGAQQPPPRPRS